MSTLNPTSDEWYERLKKIFSPDQLESITAYLEQVERHGWGGVTVEFSLHHPDKWRAWPVFSNMFERPKMNRYRPE